MPFVEVEDPWMEMFLASVEIYTEHFGTPSYEGYALCAVHADVCYETNRALLLSIYESASLTDPKTISHSELDALYGLPTAKTNAGDGTP